MEVDCGGFWEGLIEMMRFLQMDVMAKLVVADLEAWGVLPVVAIILVYRILIEALLYRKVFRPMFNDRR